jgi:hypothetical protein
MRHIPRGVLATRSVDVAEHGARAIRRNVLVLLRQCHAVRRPVVAGVIGTVRKRPALGARTSQDVALIGGRRRGPHAWHLVTLDIKCGGTLDVVAVALLIVMQIGDVLRRLERLARMLNNRRFESIRSRANRPYAVRLRSGRGALKV